MTGSVLLEACLAHADCGEDLEFDPAFVALQAAAQGKAEQQFGDTVVEAEEPDWRDVEAKALALLERARDLRVVGHLAAARLRTRGLPGYAEAVALTARLLEQHWETVHPRLDPDDDNDPTMRSNAVLALGDPKWVMRSLREQPLTRGPRAGRFGWRQIAPALNLAEAEEGTEVPPESLVAAAFGETDPAWMQGLRDAVAGIDRDLKAIGTAFDEKAGYGAAPDLGRLERLIGDMHRVLERFAVATGDAGAEPEAEAEAAPADAIATPAAAPRRGGGFASVLAMQEVATRPEALHLLEVACRYFEHNEPSSPLPLLVRRALRLSDKSFLDILRDLAPDGMQQAQLVAGITDD